MKSFILKYKLLLIPLVPLLFVMSMLSFILSGENISQPEISNDATPQDSSQNINPTQPDADEEETEGHEELDTLSGLIRTEALPDGSMKHFYTSPVAGRPNTLIIKGEDVVFESSVTDSAFPVNITDYTNSYGEARWVFKGSRFYGDGAEVHIYADQGIAIIVNPASGNVFEQHIFEPMRVEEYVRNYGEDIP